MAGTRLGVTAPTVAVADPSDIPTTEPSAPDPWALDPASVATWLGTDPVRGLDPSTASERLARHGPNETEVRPPVSVMAALVRAATEPFVILLAIAGAMAVALGEVRDGLLVLIGLVPIVGADVLTEYRSDRALAELRAAAAPRARVRRDGVVRDIPAREVVPGDLVVLRVGDVVPADVRVVRAEALTLDRSILTGESLPEEARVAADPRGTALPDRRSMAYAGTSVVLGRGEGLTVATGPATEVGRIAGALGPVERDRSPLQRELDRLVRILLVVAISLIVVTVGLGLARGSELGEALLAGISAAIAAIPEEPPILLAVILGLGAYRLLHQGVLVRRLNAQETLGAIDLILTDKTGTLTVNRLELEAVWTPDGRVEDASSRSSLVSDAIRAEDDAWSTGAGEPRGSFTTALLEVIPAAEVHLDAADLVEASGPRDDRPYSMTRALRAGGMEVLVLGAPEAVLRLVASGPEVRGWSDLVERSAGAGRRLLLLAGGPDDDHVRPRAVLAFSDRLRDGVPEALRVVAEAGIATTIVTGDHPATASSIARSAGLQAGRVMTGDEIDALDDAALTALLPELRVVGRATPTQKLRLVTTARLAGRTVAVTGDGVNDAPALQRADVGVAMGSGTAVAREAADLVLGDDSFVTLVHGAAEGRRIVANVQKGLVFLISTHVALLGYILIATLAGIGQPLLPLQILWLELFIDISSSIAFEREPAEPDAMRRPPRPRGIPLLTDGLLARIGVAGSVTAVAALAVTLANSDDPARASWLACNILVFGQLVRAYANRRLDAPVWSLPPNRTLAAVCLAVGAIQLLIPAVPLLADAFRATPLAPTELAIVALIAVAPALVGELVRTTRRGVVWVA